MFNATVVTSVDLTVAGNSTKVVCIIIGVYNETATDQADSSVDLAVSSSPPTLRFLGKVHTGIGIQRSGDIVPDVEFDDFVPKSRNRIFLVWRPLTVINRWCVYLLCRCGRRLSGTREVLSGHGPSDGD
jgi:hypothetical protein